MGGPLGSPPPGTIGIIVNPALFGLTFCNCSARTLATANVRTRHASKPKNSFPRMVSDYLHSKAKVNPNRLVRFVEKTHDRVGIKTASSLVLRVISAMQHQSTELESTRQLPPTGGAVSLSKLLAVVALCWAFGAIIAGTQWNRCALSLNKFPFIPHRFCTKSEAVPFTENVAVTKPGKYADFALPFFDHLNFLRAKNPAVCSASLFNSRSNQDRIYTERHSRIVYHFPWSLQTNCNLVDKIVRRSLACIYHVQFSSHRFDRAKTVDGRCINAHVCPQFPLRMNFASQPESFRSNVQSPSESSYSERGESGNESSVFIKPSNWLIPAGILLFIFAAPALAINFCFSGYSRIGDCLIGGWFLLIVLLLLGGLWMP